MKNKNSIIVKRPAGHVLFDEQGYAVHIGSQFDCLRIANMHKLKVANENTVQFTKIAIAAHLTH